MSDGRNGAWRRSKRTWCYVLMLVPIAAWVFAFNLCGALPESARPKPNVTFLPRSDYRLTGHYFLFRTLPHSTGLSVFCSIPYLFHFFLPLVVGCLLLLGCFYGKRCFSCRWRKFMGWLFVLGSVNLAAVVVQSAFPTAPPWWYDDTLSLGEGAAAASGAQNASLPAGQQDSARPSHELTVADRIRAVRQRHSPAPLSEGEVEEVRRDEQQLYDTLSSDEADYATLPDDSRLVESDHALGANLFGSIYGNAPIVFGSFPSLHAAWPVACMLPFWSAGPVAVAVSALYWAWIWFAAIYLKHHFLTDIVGAVALVAICSALKRLVFWAAGFRNRHAIGEEGSCRHCEELRRQQRDPMGTDSIWCRNRRGGRCTVHSDGRISKEAFQENDEERDFADMGQSASPFWTQVYSSLSSEDGA